MGRVLVVDDEHSLRDVLEVLITTEGHNAEVAASVREAEQCLHQQPYDVVVTDLRLEPDGDGMDVVRAASKVKEAPVVIVMTAYGSRDKAQAAIREGASFYLEKGPHLASDLRVLMGQAIEKRRLEAEIRELKRLGKVTDGVGRYGIIGKSESMQELFDVISRIAPLKATVLITGENGSGKERVARALHAEGPMKEGPFVAVNCGAIPEALIESELFGYKKGSFTGATQDSDGLFVSADGGTLFLDEIGELPLHLQPKLLRALQEHRVKAVGDMKERPIDVRVVAATNRDLEREVREGRFREDLYFRLNVLPIEIPPLRMRRADVPLLAEVFLKRFAREHGRDVRVIQKDAMRLLLDYSFPGNVRELENLIERGVALALTHEITRDELPREILQSRPSLPTRPVNGSSSEKAAPFPEEGIDLERMIERYEAEMIEKALKKADGVKTKAAELLGLSFRQLRYKISKYGRVRDEDE